MEGLAAILEWSDAQDAIAASGQWITSKAGTIVGARYFQPDVYADMEFDAFDLLMRETPNGPSFTA